jgi:hypothetical protein
MPWSKVVTFTDPFPRFHAKRLVNPPAKRKSFPPRGEAFEPA